VLRIAAMRMSNKEIGEAQVLEKFGVTPDKVVDVQSLAGDSVDNVPGVPGIGLKTGAELINTYGSLEALLGRASEIKQNKRRENLIAFAEQARISKRLVTLDDHVPVEEDVGSFAVDTPKASQLIGFLKALEFSTFTRKVAGELQADMAAIEPVPVEINHWPPEGGLAPTPAPKLAAAPAAESGVPETVIAPPPQPSSAEGEDDLELHLRAIPVIHAAYETVTTAERLRAWVAAAEAQGFVSFDSETDSLDAMRAEIAGLSLALEPGRACYVPLNHKSLGEGLFGGERLAGLLGEEEALAIVAPLLAAPHVLKIGQNLKFDMLVLKQRGITIAPFDDTMLMSYAFESGDVGHG
jgi:DNA polymerase-1